MQSSLEKDYCFLSPRLSSSLTGEGSCKWGRGWFLEVESDGGRKGRGDPRRKKDAVGFSQEKKFSFSFSLLGYRFLFLLLGFFLLLGCCEGVSGRLGLLGSSWRSPEGEDRFPHVVHV